MEDEGLIEVIERAYAKLIKRKHLGESIDNIFDIITYRVDLPFQTKTKLFAIGDYIKGIEIDGRHYIDYIRG